MAHYAPGAIVLVSLVVQVLLAHGQTPADGVALFASNCAACHGVDGRSGERAPDIVSRKMRHNRSYFTVLEKSECSPDSRPRLTGR